MTRQSKESPRVTRGVFDNAEDAAEFTPRAWLQKRKTVAATFPAKRNRPFDVLEINLQEGDWEHTVVWLAAKIGSGIAEAPLDGWGNPNGTMSWVQFDRLIEGLQRVRAEAERMGLRTPRRQPRAAK